MSGIRILNIKQKTVSDTYYLAVSAKPPGAGALRVHSSLCLATTLIQFHPTKEVGDEKAEGVGEFFALNNVKKCPWGTMLSMEI